MDTKQRDTRKRPGILVRPSGALIDRLMARTLPGETMTQTTRWIYAQYFDAIEHAHACRGRSRCLASIAGRLEAEDDIRHLHALATDQ